MVNAIIFGASKTGEKVYNLIRYIYNVHSFCDNDESKWGASHCGLPIVSPREMKRFLEENGPCCIIVASIYYYSIAAQLDMMGIQSFLIFKDKDNRFYKSEMMEDEIKQLSDFYAVHKRIDLKADNPKKATLSVLVPTRNRDLSNCLDHLKKVAEYIDLRVWILDSGEPEAQSENGTVIASMADLCIHHMCFPPDTDINRKVFSGLQKVETEYSIFLADDDYLFVKGVLAALEMLGNTPDVDLIKGRTLYFHNGDIERMLVVAPTMPEWQDDAVKRLIAFSVRMVDFYYSVARTCSYKKAFEILVNLKHYDEMDVYFKERLYYMIFILCNNVVRIKDFISAKDSACMQHYAYMEPYRSDGHIRRNMRFFYLSLTEVFQRLGIDSVDEGLEAYLGANFLACLPWYLF